MLDESLNDWCERLGACPEAVDWVKTLDWKTAWDECPRGDWMLWALARKVGEPGWPTKQQLVLCACDIVETALAHIPEGEDHPRIAIETARRWALGECKRAEVADAAYVAAYAAANACANASDFGAARDAQLKWFAGMIRERFTDLPFMETK